MDQYRRSAYIALWILLLPALVWLFRADAAPADGKVHIRYWEKWTGFEEEAMRKTVNAFNAKPGNRIFVEYLPVSQVNQKMLLATAGGGPPGGGGGVGFGPLTSA